MKEDHRLAAADSSKAFINPTDETGDGGKVGPNIYEATKNQLLHPEAAAVGQGSAFREVEERERTAMSIRDMDDSLPVEEEENTFREQFNFGEMDAKEDAEAKRIWEQLQKVKDKNTRLEQERSKLIA